MPRTMTPPANILPGGMVPAATGTTEATPAPAAAPPMASPVTAETDRDPESAPFDTEESTTAEPATEPATPTQADDAPPPEVLSIETSRKEIEAAAGSQTSVAEMLAERKLLDAIYFLSCQVRDLESQEEAILLDLNAVQVELGTARDERNKAIASLSASLIELREGGERSPNRKPEPVKEFAGVPLVTEADDDSWKTIPTPMLLDGIEGLGRKRIEAIADEFPTAGHLENGRAEAAKARNHFHKILPRGTGKEIASRIEDRLLDAAMGKWACPQVTGKDPEPTAETTTKPEVIEDPELDTSGEMESAERRIRSNARSIAATATPESLAYDGTEEWTAGLDAKRDGEPVDACPEMDLTREESWLKGWLLGHLYGGQSSPEEERDAPPAKAVSVETDPVTTFASPTFIRSSSGMDEGLRGWINEMVQAISEKIFTKSTSTIVTDIALFRDGAECFAAGENLTEIPTEIDRGDLKWTPSTKKERISWIYGWLHARAVKKGVIGGGEPVDTAEPETPAEVVAAEPAAEPAPVAEPEPVKQDPAPTADPVQPAREAFDSIVERVKASGWFKCKSDQLAWDAGRAAGVDELPISDPGGSTASREDYVRGYLFTETDDLFSGL